MKNRFLVIVVAVLMPPTFAFAQSSARDDANIDLKMNAPTISGIAPPTGSQAVPATVNAQRFVDPYLPAAMQQQGKIILGQTDGKGRVYEIRGQVTLTPKGTPVEKKLKKGDIVSAGDRIQTEASSAVSITFDESYKNALRIPENSKAVFESIEPTNIRIENGSVFSAVNGLPQGGTWKVTTPSTVAAVRGTLYLVSYQALDGQFRAATVNVADDGKDSKISIQSVLGPESVSVPEGKQITLKQGEKPDLLLVKDIDPRVLEEIWAFFENLLDLQEESENFGNAPATSGQYAPGEADTGVDQNLPDLDQQDMGVPPDPIKEDESSPIRIGLTLAPRIDTDRDEAGSEIIDSGKTIHATANPNQE